MAGNGSVGIGIGIGDETSITMIAGGWSVLSTADDCSNAADGPGIPEVFWVVVVVAAWMYIRLWNETRDRAADPS